MSAQHGTEHLNLFSLTSDPSKPGAGTTLLTRGHPKMRPVNLSAARTSPQRDETVVSPNSLVVCPALFPALYLLCLVKQISALQACNRMRNSQADGAPMVPGSPGASLRGPFSFGRQSSCLKNACTFLHRFHCLPRGQATAFLPAVLVNLVRQSTTSAPAGNSPCSRYFHNAINSLRATATTPIFRARLLPS